MGRKRKEDTKPTKTVTKTFRLHKVQYDFHHSDALYRAFVGGIGCVAPETILGGTPIGDLTSSAGECQTLLGVAPRTASFCKGKDDLYRVTMVSGRQVLVTLAHRFLTPEGWLPLSKLGIGHELACDDSDYGLSDWEKSTSLTGGYSQGFRRDDGLFRPEEAFFVDSIRQLCGQICGDGQIGDQLRICHPSTSCSFDHKTHGHPSTSLSYRGESSSSVSPQVQHHTSCQYHLLSFQNYIYQCNHGQVSCGQHGDQYDLSDHKIGKLSSEQMILKNLLSERFQTEFYRSTKDKQSLSILRSSWDTIRRLESLKSNLLYLSPFCFSVNGQRDNFTAFWDKIQDISFARHGEYYDLTVPGLEHYSANGIYHHNSGKSWIGAYDMLKRAMAPDNSGKLFCVVAPTFTLMRDASQRTMIQLAEELGVVKEIYKQPPELILNNGATIIFRSGEDPEKLRGPNISGIWLDEASLMTKDVWDICIGRLREGGKAGWITATFTPKGMSNWTYEMFGKPDRPNTVLFRSKTKDNPFLPREFIHAVKESYDDNNAKQELDGEFISQTGCEWPNSYFGEDIWVDSMPEGHDLTISTMALDPSKGKNSKHGDYSTTVKLGRGKDGLLYVDADLRRCDAETLTDFFVSQMADFYPDRVGIEVNQFQHLMSKEISKAMKSRNIDIPIVEIYNSINKEVRIRRLGPHLRNKKFRFVRNPGTILGVSQLREFPLGKHDDFPDCLEMALRVMIQTWNNRQVIRTKGVKA